MEKRLRLAPFLLVSLAAHAAALWPASAALSWPAQRPRGASLHVQLALTAAPPRLAPQPARTARTVRGQARSVTPVVPTAHADADRQTPPARVPDTAANAAADVGAAARVHATLERALARYFVYPERARERGWEGRVLLAFRVQTDGRLDQVRVEHSCGYSLLDRAALAALQQVARIDASAVGLRGALDVRLPVVYHLTED